MKFFTSHVQVLDYMAVSLRNAVGYLARSRLIFCHATGHGIILLRQRVTRIHPVLCCPICGLGRSDSSYQNSLHPCFEDHFTFVFEAFLCQQ